MAQTRKHWGTFRLGRRQHTHLPLNPVPVSVSAVSQTGVYLLSPNRFKETLGSYSDRTTIEIKASGTTPDRGGPAPRAPVVGGPRTPSKRRWTWGKERPESPRRVGPETSPTERASGLSSLATGGGTHPTVTHSVPPPSLPSDPLLRVGVGDFLALRLFTVTTMCFHAVIVGERFRSPNFTVIVSFNSNVTSFVLNLVIGRVPCRLKKVYQGAPNPDHPRIPSPVPDRPLPSPIHCTNL